MAVRSTISWNVPCTRPAPVSADSYQVASPSTTQPGDDDAREREGRLRPPEQCAENPAQRPAVVEMEDVRQLVRDQLLEPVVEVGQREMIGGRPGEKDDAVGGPDRGEAVRCVVVVRQDDVDAPGWPRAELCRELPVGLLGQVSHPPAQRLKVLRKGDAKVLGLDRTPRFVGRHLSSRRRTNEQTNEYRDWKAVRPTRHVGSTPWQAGSFQLRKRSI